MFVSSNLPPDPSADIASREIVVSSDLAPDPSYGLDSVGVLAQGFCGTSNHQQYQTMLRNFNLQLQPLGTLSDHLQGTALVSYFFGTITQIFREVGDKSAEYQDS